MTKEWIEQKAKLEARIAELESEVKVLQAGNGAVGLHIVEETPSKILVPGQRQAGGLKIILSGINPHAAMHACIQTMAWLHQNIMAHEAEMAMASQKPALDAIRLVN